MPGLLDHRGEQRAGLVGLLVARVGDGEHGDAHRDKGTVSSIWDIVGLGVTGPPGEAGDDEVSLYVDRRLQRQKIAPGEALLLRVAQQIGRMERGKRRQVAPRARIAQPFAAEPHDAFARAEDGLCRGAAEQHQHLRRKNSIWRARNGAQASISSGVGVRLPGGRQ